MFQKIMYPVDFSPSCEAILRAFPELKSFNMKEIVIVHIIEYDPVALVEGGVNIDEFIFKLKEKAEEKLKSYSETLKNYGFKVKTYLRASVNPVEEILRFAEKEKVSAIMIGSKSRTIANALMGSTSEGIVRASEVPVLLIKTKSGTGTGYYEMILRNIFSRIVYPHDLSENSDKLFEIVKNAALMGMQDVVIIHAIDAEVVIERKIEKGEIIHPLVPISYITEILSEYWMETKKKLEDIKKRFEMENIESKIVIKFGSPGREIVRVAREEGASVIIMAPKTITQTVDTVVRYSEVPVLILK